MDEAGRYAIYFSPEDATALGRFGRQWLGGADARAAVPGFSLDRLAEITAEPRRYGFHATLKPPFALAAGSSARELAASMVSFATAQAGFPAPPLALASIAGFWALIPSQPCPALDRLAADCVRHFDAFRAPPSADELAKRRRAGLTAAQEALLARWGYPYVMDAFRFHLTLTSRLDAAEGAALKEGLAPIVAPLCRAPLVIDAISLFHEPAAGGQFRLVRRYLLGGTNGTA